MILALAAAATVAQAAADDTKQLEPFWLKPPLQTAVEFRPTDTIISVPAKSGTTWTMNIFHQLRTGGDADFTDIYKEVPWMEFKERPDQTDKELLDRWKAMPHDVPRAFKTHQAPGPFLEYREDLKYVVVVRNPEEGMVSFLKFLRNHRSEWWEYWNAEPMRDAFVGDPSMTFSQWFENSAMNFSPAPGVPAPPGGLLTVFFLGFVNGWWPLRSKPNVLMLHFSEMKKDHEGSLRKIADHLGFSPTEEQWPNIIKYTSFEWMKEHQSKFEAATVSVMPLMETGAMVRKGATGKQYEDGMTEEISEQIHKFADMIIQDPAAIEWMFNGGPIPPATESGHNEL